MQKPEMIHQELVDHRCQLADCCSLLLRRRLCQTDTIYVQEEGFFVFLLGQRSTHLKKSKKQKHLWALSIDMVPSTIEVEVPPRPLKRSKDPDHSERSSLQNLDRDRRTRLIFCSLHKVKKATSPTGSSVRTFPLRRRIFSKAQRSYGLLTLCHSMRKMC